MVSDVIFEALESIKEYKKGMPDIYNKGLTKEHVDNLVKHMEDVMRFLDTYNSNIQSVPVVGTYEIKEK